MKKYLVPTLMIVLLILTGCVSSELALGEQPTSTPAVQPTAQPTQVKVDLPFTNQKILTDLAQQTGIPEDQISVLSVQKTEWPDSCLGIPKKGAACLDVITPGYVIVFSTPQGDYTFHTNQDGSRFLQASTSVEEQAPVITWERTGGIAGICRRFTLYANSSFLFEDCRTKKDLNQGALLEKDWTYLSGMLKTYGTFQWKPLANAGAADAFQDQYHFNGSGAEALAVDQQEALNIYLNNLINEMSINAFSPAPEVNGIEGQALYGPVCPGPVKAGDPKCADQLYQATITVLDQNGKTVANFRTGAEGRFRVTLTPGNYILHPQSGQPMPVAGDVEVTVSAGQFVQVTIHFDSGIR